MLRASFGPQQERLDAANSVSLKTGGTHAVLLNTAQKQSSTAARGKESIAVLRMAPHLHFATFHLIITWTASTARRVTPASASTLLTAQNSCVGTAVAPVSLALRIGWLGLTRVGMRW